MKTMIKTVAVLGGLLLLAACSAAAEDTTPKSFGPGYGPGYGAGNGPGWRHEQMVKAVEKGEFPGPMMMRGQRGFGPPVGADGKIDTSKLPEWCPAKQAATK